MYDPTKNSMLILFLRYCEIWVFSWFLLAAYVRTTRQSIFYLLHMYVQLDNPLFTCCICTYNSTIHFACNVLVIPNWRAIFSHGDIPRFSWFGTSVAIHVLYFSEIRLSSFVNPLQPGIAFLYPLKTSENLKVFWRF